MGRIAIKEVNLLLTNELVIIIEMREGETESILFCLIKL